MMALRKRHCCVSVCALWLAYVALGLRVGGGRRTSLRLLRADAQTTTPWEPQPPASVVVAAARIAARCTAPSARWAPTRIARGYVAGHKPLVVYHNVLLAGCCARATTGGGPRGGAASCEGRVWDAADAGAVVWTTHLSPPRHIDLATLARRWGGCMSVTVSVCSREEWVDVVRVWESDAALRSYATLHVLLGNTTVLCSAYNQVRISPHR